MNSRFSVVTQLGIVGCACLLLVSTGCSARKSIPSRFEPRDGLPIERLVVIYDQVPIYLNLDINADRDPEGIQFCAYLIPREGKKGVFREGDFKIELFTNFPDGKGGFVRKAVDYNYSATDLHQIGRGGVMGQGYLIRVVFPSKEFAGRDIDVVVTYTSPEGRTVRSGVKSLRVPTFRKPTTAGGYPSR